MTIQVQRRRGDTSAHSTFTGAEGEITVNTTEWTAHVHDGTTAGGHKLAKQSDLDSAIPASAVMPFARNTPPSGWLECDGSAVSRTTYADLFAAIGTTYGSGDGSTTFNLPDLRAEFVRGWDNGRGVDSGRSFGSNQSDEFKSHDHIIDENVGAINNTGSGAIASEDINGNSVRSTQTTGGTETRPRNVALLYCIKY